MSKEEKKRFKCTHGLESGHEVDECFKLHGVPDWYKRYKENRMSNRVNMVDNDEDNVSSHGSIDQKDMSTDMGKIIQTEIVKYVQFYIQQGSTLAKTYVNFVQESHKRDNHFDGHYAFTTLSNMDKDVWIVDSGAMITFVLIQNYIALPIDCIN